MSFIGSVRDHGHLVDRSKTGWWQVRARTKADAQLRPIEEMLKQAYDRGRFDANKPDAQAPSMVIDDFDVVHQRLGRVFANTVVNLKPDARPWQGSLVPNEHVHSAWMQLAWDEGPLGTTNDPLVPGRPNLRRMGAIIVPFFWSAEANAYKVVAIERARPHVPDALGTVPAIGSWAVELPRGFALPLPDKSSVFAVRPQRPNAAARRGQTPAETADRETTEELVRLRILNEMSLGVLTCNSALFTSVIEVSALEISFDPADRQVNTYEIDPSPGDGVEPIRFKVCDEHGVPVINYNALRLEDLMDQYANQKLVEESGKAVPFNSDDVIQHVACGLSASALALFAHWLLRTDRCRVQWAPKPNAF